MGWFLIRQTNKIMMKARKTTLIAVAMILLISQSAPAADPQYMYFWDSQFNMDPAGVPHPRVPPTQGDVGPVTPEGWQMICLTGVQMNMDTICLYNFFRCDAFFGDCPGCAVINGRVGAYGFPAPGYEWVDDEANLYVCSDIAGVTTGGGSVWYPG